MPAPRASVLDLPPYVQGKSEVDGINDVIKLSSNEAAFGAHPEVAVAIQTEFSNLHRYPEGSQYDLRSAIGQKFNLDPERMICGNGSEELILLLIRAFIEPGDELLMSQYGFIMYEIHGRAQGAHIVKANERNFRTDVDALLSAVSEKTRLVAIANPNNPTGSYISGTELRRLHAQLPASVLLLIDSAYADYCTAEDYEDGANLAHQSENVVMLRTFSKIYGLAGLRIGWAYGSRNLVEILQRIRTPFNTNRLALAAARAALQHDAFVQRSRDHNCRERQRLMAALNEIGLRPIPSEANFILIEFPEERCAREASEFLMRMAVIPRWLGPAGPPNCLRITIGSRFENDTFLMAITRYMNSGSLK